MGLDAFANMTDVRLFDILGKLKDLDANVQEKIIEEVKNKIDEETAKRIVNAE